MGGWARHKQWRARCSSPVQKQGRPLLLWQQPTRKGSCCGNRNLCKEIWRPEPPLHVALGNRSRSLVPTLVGHQVLQKIVDISQCIGYRKLQSVLIQYNKLVIDDWLLEWHQISATGFKKPLKIGSMGRFCRNAMRPFPCMPMNRLSVQTSNFWLMFAALMSRIRGIK